MHIVHLTPYYAPAYAFGGVPRAIEGLATALIARGHRVSVLTTDAHTHQQRQPGPLHTIREGVSVWRVPNRLYALRRFNLSTPEGLRRVAARVLADADLLHLHEFRTLENILVAPLAASRGLPVVLSPHGTLAPDAGRGTLKRGWDALLSPRVARHIDAVTALTQHEADEVRDLWPRWGLPVPTIRVIANGIDPQQFASLPDAAPFRARFDLGSAPIVLYLGRLHPRKGITELVAAWEHVRVPGACLVLAGPDEGALTQLGPLPADRITVTGYLDGEARLQALAAADMFVLPALAGEGLSLSILEALAAGLPVVLSPACHLPEVAAADAGIITAPQPETLAAAITDLLLDAERRHRMGQAARALVQQQFTWSAVGAAAEAEYAQLAARSSARS